MCEVIPQDPPSTALGGGSQETGEGWSGKAWSGGEVPHDDKRSDTDTLCDNYLDKIEEVVTLYNDGQAATKVPVCGVVPRVPPAAALGRGSEELGNEQDADGRGSYHRKGLRLGTTARERAEQSRTLEPEIAANQVGSKDDDIVSCPSRVATKRRAKNGELRKGIAKTKGKAQRQQRDAFLEEKIARLEGQNARIECIDREVEQLRGEISRSPPGPPRRRLRQVFDALLAERELMCLR